MSELAQGSIINSIFFQKTGENAGHSARDYAMYHWDTELIDMKQYLTEQDLEAEKMEEITEIYEITDEDAETSVHFWCDRNNMEEKMEDIAEICEITDEEPETSVHFWCARNNSLNLSIYTLIFLVIFSFVMAGFVIIYKYLKPLYE